MKKLCVYVCSIVLFLCPAMYASTSQVSRPNTIIWNDLQATCLLGFLSVRIQEHGLSYLHAQLVQMAKALERETKEHILFLADFFKRGFLASGTQEVDQFVTKTQDRVEQLRRLVAGTFSSPTDLEKYVRNFTRTKATFHKGFAVVKGWAVMTNVEFTVLGSPDAQRIQALWQQHERYIRAYCDVFDSFWDTFDGIWCAGYRQYLPDIGPAISELKTHGKDQVQLIRGAMQALPAKDAQVWVTSVGKILSFLSTVISDKYGYVGDNIIGSADLRDFVAAKAEKIRAQEAEEKRQKAATELAAVQTTTRTAKYQEILRKINALELTATEKNIEKIIQQVNAGIFVERDLVYIEKFIYKFQEHRQQAIQLCQKIKISDAAYGQTVDQIYAWLQAEKKILDDACANVQRWLDEGKLKDEAPFKKYIRASLLVGGSRAIIALVPQLIPQLRADKQGDMQGSWDSFLATGKLVWPRGATEEQKRILMLVSSPDESSIEQLTNELYQEQTSGDSAKTFIIFKLCNEGFLPFLNGLVETFLKQFEQYE